MMNRMVAACYEKCAGTSVSKKEKKEIGVVHAEAPSVVRPARYY